MFIINECKTILHLIDEDEFEKILLPAITKAMLRNSEIILQCVGQVISYLSIDLSKHAMSIGKGLSGELLLKYTNRIFLIFILINWLISFVIFS